MSVYTVIEVDELAAFLADYEVGALVRYSGISAGIENTNYFVTTGVGEYVLTLFESTPASELPYFLDLMAHLAEHGVPSAHPIADRQGRYLRELRGRPCALVRRLPGGSVAYPDAAHCAAIGSAMARMHRVGTSFALRRASDRGPRWREETCALVAPRLAPDERELLAAYADRMLALAAEQPGYLGVESVRGADGVGITVSYWSSLEAIRAWRVHAEHRLAQEKGRETA